MDCCQHWSTLVTDLSQRARGRGRCATRRSAARRPRPRPARRPRRDELGHRRDRAPRRRSSSAPASPAPTTSVISPFGGSANARRELGGRPARDLLEPLRQLAADRDRRARAAPPRASAATPAAAAATRTRRPATSHAAQLLPERARARLPAAAGSRRRRSGRRRARSRRAPSRPPTAPAAPSPATPAASAARTSARPGIGDPGQPGVRDERDPLARLEPRQHLGASARPRCARGRRAAAPRSRAGRAGAACAGCPRRARRRPRAARRARAASRRRGCRSASRRPRAARRLRRAPRTRRARRRSGRPSARARRPRAARARRPARAPRAATTSRAGPSSSSPAATPKPPPITTTSGSKRLTSDAIAAPRCVPICVERRMALLDQVARRRRRPEQLAREAVGGVARAVRLDVAAARAGALARLAVLDDHHVPDLGPAAVELAVDDDPAADAGAERQQHEVVRAPPGAVRELGERRRAPVVDHADRHAEPRREHLPQPRRPAIGVFTAPNATPVRWSTRAGTPNPTATTSGRAQLDDRLDERVEQLVLRVERRRRSRTLERRRPASSRTPARIFVPPRSTPITRPPAHPAGTLLRRMAPKDKPYRVYRVVASRARCRRCPAPTRPPPSATRRAAAGAPPRPRGRARASGGRRWKLIVLIVPLARASLLAIVWGVIGFLSFPSGVSDANKRLRPRARREGRARRRATASCSTTARRSCCSARTASTAAGRSGDRHSDSIMLAAHRPVAPPLSYLSIPRDLLVPVPGVGNAKINAAYQAGGAALAIKTVHEFTGVPINHVVDRRLQRLQGPDRRRGRDHDQRPGADPLEPLRLPVHDAGACQAVEGLALRARAAAHERRARADLLADPREPAQPGRERPHRAARASRR